MADTAELDQAWGAPIRVLCSRNGPACGCGSYTYRARTERQGGLVRWARLRCEACGSVKTVDLDEPGRPVTVVDGQPRAIDQQALF